MVQPQNAMEIFQLLDKSNCRECGEKTCLAFAGAVFMGQKSLDRCPKLDREIIAKYGGDSGQRNTIEQEQEAAMQQVSVNGKIKRGNPVRSFLEAGAAADLLVLGTGKGPTRPFEYAITTHIAYWSQKSLLLVPVLE